MLGLIAQFALSLLQINILRNAMSLLWIWKQIRKYYPFFQSEANFLKLASIVCKDEECY